MAVKVLNKKTNKANVSDLMSKDSIFGKIMITSVVMTKNTVKFSSNEKNGKLAPLASDVLAWAKKNGVEMVSRTLGKPKKNNEYFEGKTQDVVWQWTSYTLK